MEDGYPPDWDTRRKHVYRRDGYQCQGCGRRGAHRGDAELHAHHVVPKSRGGSHSTENLTTLCSDCHSRVHGHPVGGNVRKSSDPPHSIENVDPEEAFAPIIFFCLWIFIGIYIGAPIALLPNFMPIPGFVGGVLALYILVDFPIEYTRKDNPHGDHPRRIPFRVKHFIWASILCTDALIMFTFENNATKVSGLILGVVGLVLWKKFVTGLYNDYVAPHTN